MAKIRDKGKRFRFGREQPGILNPRRDDCGISTAIRKPLAVAAGLTVFGSAICHAGPNTPPRIEHNLYSVSKDDAQLRVVDRANAGTLSSISMSGDEAIGKGIGLAVDPLTGELWGLLENSSVFGRSLGKLIPRMAPSLRLVRPAITIPDWHSTARAACFWWPETERDTRNRSSLSTDSTRARNFY